MSTAQVSLSVTTRLKIIEFAIELPVDRSMQKYPSRSNWNVSPGLAEVRLGSTYAFVSTERDCWFKSFKKSPSSWILPGLGAEKSLKEKNGYLNRLFSNIRGCFKFNVCMDSEELKMTANCCPIQSIHQKWRHSAVRILYLSKRASSAFKACAWETHWIIPLA